jgi:hypothetical protein
MRRIFSLIAAVILLALVVLIIQRQPDSTRPPAESTDTSLAPTVTTRPTTDRTVPTTVGATPDTDATTDSTDAAGFDTTPTTADDPTLQARFAITQVVFGEAGYVVVTNVGGAAGSIGGYALCQRPNYLNLPDIELQPFGSIWIAAGDGSALTASPVEVVSANGGLSAFDRRDGEMALYSTPDFGSPDAIRSYVEWGSSGHGRSSVAVEAGLWVEDAFIEIPADADSVQAVSQDATGPEDWVAGLGG